MSERKPLKLDEVEWDGLLLCIVKVLNVLLPMERILNSAAYNRLAACVNYINPCHSKEESLSWRIMCFLFPGCWCCSGIRGVIYGVVVTLLIILIAK